MAVAGMAFPLGMVGVIGGYILFDSLGIGLRLEWNASLQAGLGVLLGIVAWWRWRKLPRNAPSVAGDTWVELPRWGKWLLVAVIGCIGVRWLGIVAEVMYRPLFPWDAWYAYGMQAKVWFFAERLGVFANFNDWFESPEPAWAAGGVRHPPGIGLTQLWMVQSLGYWDDALMNLPWPMLGGSIGLIVAGLARLSGVRLLATVLSVWVVMTLPMLNIHAALAGYGDLWIAAYVLVVAGSVALPFRGHDRSLFLVAGIGGAGLLLIKEVGLMWLAVLAMAASAVRFSATRASIMAGVLVALLIAWLWWSDSVIQIGILGRYGFSDGHLVVPSHVPMWGDLLRHLFVYPNWHLFWYLLAATLIMIVPIAKVDPAIRMLSFVGYGGVLMLIAVFALSDLGSAVVDGTSVNRLVLHTVPVLGVLLAVSFGKTLPEAEHER